jgi:hypothetical protein
MTLQDMMRWLRGKVAIGIESWDVECPAGFENSCDDCQYFLDEEYCGKERGMVFKELFVGNIGDAPIRYAGLLVSEIRADKRYPDAILVVIKQEVKR